jgi:hypothetical protein
LFLACFACCLLQFVSFDVICCSFCVCAHSLHHTWLLVVGGPTCAWWLRRRPTKELAKTPLHAFIYITWWLRRRPTKELAKTPLYAFTYLAWWLRRRPTKELAKTPLYACTYLAWWLRRRPTKELAKTPLHACMHQACNLLCLGPKAQSKANCASTCAW